MSTSAARKEPKSDRLKGKRTLKVDHFFDDFEKDDLKSKVDLVTLFSYFGVQLKQKGKSYIGLCPWHDDKNPSLSVDREKGLYNCFGCGESGDIFTLVEKMKGYDFKEAKKFLQGFVNVGHPPIVLAAKKRDQKQRAKQNNEAATAEAQKEVSGSDTKDLIEPKEQSKKPVFQSEASKEKPDARAWEHLDLNRVANYYHRTLTGNKIAQEYLKDRGITNLSLWQRFNIGFADGSVLSKIGERQKGELTKLGILRDSAKEHLQDCVTFPITDDYGNTVQLYGRNISGSANTEHLYLKGKHKGVFNRKASKVYDEIILTESIFDALSLMQLGFENAQSIYGTNGFTEKHLNTLKDDRVKTVIVALDNDNPGRQAASNLKEKLLEEGFAVKMVFPSIISAMFYNPENSQSNDLSATQELLGPLIDPQGEPLKNPRPKGEEEKADNSQIVVKDWNDYLLYGISSGKSEAELKQKISELIEQANIESRQRSDVSSSSILGSDSPFEVTKEKLGTRFVFDDLSYLVSGVKELFVSNLKVNIKAVLRGPQEPFDGDKYYDNLDLYSARSRKSFSQSLSTELNQEPKRVERDLIDILEYLENERDKSLGEDKDDELYMSEEERRLGMEFLQSPEMMDIVQQDLEMLGYVGETRIKKLMYLAATSRLMESPISVLVLSQSASGKSMLIDSVKKLIPLEGVIAINSLSEQALNYAEDLIGKFLVLGEAVHGEVVEHQIREMLSAKELSRFVAVKDRESGTTKSKLNQREVRVAIGLTGTRDDMNPENMSRFFVANMDESREQTRRIHKAQREKYSLKRYHVKERLVPEIIKKHHAAQRLLKNRVIHNGFSDYLDFPDNQMRARRDHERFIDLIAVVCFIRQYQKEVKLDEGKTEYIECDFKDYEIAYDIMINGVLSSTLMDIPVGVKDFYESLRDLARGLAEKKNLSPGEVTFTQRDVREHTGFGHTWVKKNIKILTDYEYVIVTRGGGVRSKGFYRLQEDEAMENLDISMIPTPEQIYEILNQEGLNP